MKLLVAEDEAMTLKVIELKLKGEYQVITATDGESALRLAQTEHPALILLDANMPGLDGFEVLKRLKQDDALKDIPVIMLTGRSKDADMEKGLELGAEEYLTKPFNPSELMAKVRRLAHAPVS